MASAARLLTATVEEGNRKVLFDIGKLVAELKEGIQVPLPEFSFVIGWSGNYDDLFRDLFRGARLERTGLDALVHRAFTHGRVMLHGRGGDAKTVILRRIALDVVVEPRQVAVLVDLSKWTGADYGRWKMITGVRDRVDFLLRRFGLPRVTAITLDMLWPEVNRLLLVDGLNEVFMETARELLATVDEYSRMAVGLGVIVSDRLVRREFGTPERWRLARVLPLTPEEIKRQLLGVVGSAVLFDKADEDTQLLLAAPIFLNATLQQRQRMTGSAAVHEEIFRQRCSLDVEEEMRTSIGAFQAYVESASRTFPLDKFEQQAGAKVIRKLQSGGVLLVADGEAHFDHHLRHDYLIARYLASHDAEWEFEVLNQVTFHANSFDVLALTLELIKESDAADRFIRKIYDWNQYGAAYALAETRQRRSAAVSLEMEIALLATLAEKRWDVIVETATRVRDSLSLIPTDEARQFLQAKTLEHVLDIVRSVEGRNELFKKWQGIFCRPIGSFVNDEELEGITDEEGLLGWTWANVLKRSELKEIQLSRLREWLSDKTVTVLWRVVHTLGSFPRRENADALFGILDKTEGEHMWVRYGAVRSLFEMAATARDTLRQYIFEGMAKRMEKIANERRVVEEFQRAVFIDKNKARTSTEWGQLVIGLVDVLRATERLPLRREHWNRLWMRVRIEYDLAE